MNTWTKSGITIVAIAAMSQLANAQSGDKMGMGKPMSYTGCVEAGEMAGSFMLSHPMAEMRKDGMKKDGMAKDNMAMGKDAMASMMISSKAVDLSKHVGHKVMVTGMPGEMGMAKTDGMAKPGEMAKPAGMDKGLMSMTVTSVKMVAATCSM
ncbi:MAG: hypothetical protein ABIT71_22620 [Vicinamibacteraceae bacterium]